MTTVLEFVQTALSDLPDDPAQVTSAELEILAAVAEGSARHILGLHAARQALADDLADPDRSALLLDLARAVAIDEAHKAAVAADHLLVPYLVVALRAHGCHDLAADLLAADDHPTEEDTP